MNIRHLLVSAVFMSAVPVLSGCMGTGQIGSAGALGVLAGGAYLAAEHVEKEDWHNVRPRPEATVAPVEMAHDVGFESGDATLMGAELGALESFLDRLRLAPTDEVTVTLPGSAPLSRRQGEAVAVYLGLRHRDVRVSRRYLGRVNRVRVTVRRHLVTLPACPDWSGEPGNNLFNGVSSNWGCANASNLGLMVADPRHLVAGRDMGPADGEVMTQAIGRYRSGQTKPIAILNTAKTYTFSSSEDE